MDWLISDEQLRVFEGVVFDAIRTLARATVEHVAANPDGFAFHESTGTKSLLSTNPHAWGFCSCIGITRCTVDEVREVVRFFESHAVRPRIRVPPDGWNSERAKLLASLGLRHTGFHAVLYAPLTALPTLPESGDDRTHITIEEISTAADYEPFLDVHRRGFGIPDHAREWVLTVRRPWRIAVGYRAYLAKVDGEPAAHAMMFESGDIAYLASASTLPAFRRRGLQSRLIARRIADARASGKRLMLGGAAFESNSRMNMLRSGMRVAYTAAWWERPG